MSVKIPARPAPRQDAGFFGPESITWEIVGHPVVAVAGMRNVVYSALSSEVSTAVRDHSKHMVDPLSRVKETAYWVYASVFADTIEARRAGKWVEGLHRKATGYDPVSRTEYSPLRDDLAIAGHCLIWESQLIAYETYVRKLTPAEREQYWIEGLRVPELLGIEPAIIPPTWAAWQEHYESTIVPHMNYSAAAHTLVDFTRSARYVPFWARPVMKLALAGLEELTTATLGPTERAMYGIPRSAARLAVIRAAGRMLAAVAALPPVRDGIELYLGRRIHEMMNEARSIAKNHQRRPVRTAEVA